MKPKGSDSFATSRFVFRGTVIASAAGAPPGSATVRVDQVIEAPAILVAYNGRDVVVVPPAGTRLAVGETHLFHGGGYAFGQGLTIEAVQVEDVGAAPRAAALENTWDPRAAAADRRMQQRVQLATAVVSGVGDWVRLPRAAAVAGARTAAAAPPTRTGPISEHDPRWREAVIQVAQVHKGQPGAAQVVVRFAASDDVMWFRAPKFQPGQ